jgi:phosphatidylinositol phospholipase C delta
MTVASSEGDASSTPRANKQPVSVSVSQTTAPLADPKRTALSPPNNTKSTVNSTTAAPAGSNTLTDPIPSLTIKVMSLEGFSTFLLSPDNSMSCDLHDMTRPLPEYYISSSHNTYLVGNQLMGVSTIEGYIRALLQSCRSVERKRNIQTPFPCLATDLANSRHI